MLRINGNGKNPGNGLFEGLFEGLALAERGPEGGPRTTRWPGTQER